jgi:hypothetical protein
MNRCSIEVRSDTTDAQMANRAAEIGDLFSIEPRFALACDGLTVDER